MLEENEKKLDRFFACKIEKNIIGTEIFTCTPKEELFVLFNNANYYPFIQRIGKKIIIESEFNIEESPFVIGRLTGIKGNDEEIEEIIEKLRD